MKRIIERPLWITLLAFAMSGVHHSPFSSRYLEEELEYLTRRGFTYRFVEENRIELTDPVSGSRTIKSLDEPSEAAIKGWASSQGIPILEIDPRTLDTSLYSGMYRLWTSFPLSSVGMTPLVISDFNGDGRPDACGISRNPGFPNEPVAQIYSIDSTGQATLSYTFNPYPGFAVWQGDVDGDMLKEVMIFFFELARNFEQASATSFPTGSNFVHRMRPYTGGSYSGFFVGSLDNDDSTDFLYIGAGRVSVAEYRSDTNNFVRVWEDRPESTTSLFGGFAVGDFDNDGLTEFATGEIDGRLFLAENTGNNSYQITWQDRTPFFNLYYMTQGDVDFDGRQEFFVGASMSNGIWTTVYEADSNNHYSPKFLFHLLSGGFPWGPTHLTTDLDRDGHLELIVFAASDLYVFKSTANDEYYLWYYRRAPIGTTVQAYDFFDPLRRKSLVVSRDSTDSLGNLHIYSEIYRPGSFVAVNEKEPNSAGVTLLRTYPNPFNGRTMIQYSLGVSQPIRLRVFDMLGKYVETIVQGDQSAGAHSLTWDANDLPSGMYFLSLESKGRTQVSKVILVK